MAATTSSTQRGGYSGELENWLLSHSTLMGEKSSYPGLVAAIQKGGNSGNRGSKGCGVKRVEPFDNWTTWGKVIDAFDRDSLCEQAFRGLTALERWIACARYCLRRESLPAGMYGKLGDLSGVAIVIASSISREMLRRVMEDAAAGRSGGWEEIAAKACEEMHRSWSLARAEAESEAKAALNG